jgi:hypothetical protein
MIFLGREVRALKKRLIIVFSENGHFAKSFILAKSLCSSVFKPQAQTRSVKKKRTAFLANSDEAFY